MVTLKALGQPDIVCRVYNPAYPEGIAVDFTDTLRVVVNPIEYEIRAFVGGQEVTSAKLLPTPLNVTFQLT